VSGLAERFAAEAVLAVESDAEAQARRRLEDQLRRQALHDPLTDLANRTLFTDRVAHALDCTNATVDRSVCCSAISTTSST